MVHLRAGLLVVTGVLLLAFGLVLLVLPMAAPPDADGGGTAPWWWAGVPLIVLGTVLVWYARQRRAHERRTSG